MAESNGHKRNNDDLRKELADISLRVQQHSEQRDEDNLRSEKKWLVFEKALKDLAGVVVGMGEVTNDMQEVTDKRFTELEKHVTSLVVMMNVTNGYLNETNQRMDEMNKNFSEFLKLEKMRIRNGHNGSGQGKHK